MTAITSPLDEPDIAVLMTCHNRRDTTLKCLDSLQVAAQKAECHLSLVLVDDGSTDGTAQAVAERFPDADVIGGSGSLYWAGGTRLAASRAVRTCQKATHYLWLNDDVVLDPDALDRLCSLASEIPGAVLVGAVRDPDDGSVTYSGLERRSAHPMRYSRVEPGVNPTAVETFNGNLVLIPVSVERLIGGLDEAFVHKYADLDYGHRAGEAGVPVMLAPSTFGVCPRNGEHAVGSQLTEGWKGLTGPKGLPIRLQARFLRRHGGHFWPLFLPIPYLKFLAGRVRHPAPG